LSKPAQECIVTLDRMDSVTLDHTIQVLFEGASGEATHHERVRLGDESVSVHAAGCGVTMVDLASLPF